VKDERLYLEDILARIAMIESFTVEGREAFMTSAKTQEAVIRCFEVIGEVVKRLTPEKLADYPHIPWKQIAGFRDFLLHHYNRVDFETVWRAVQNDLPSLRAAIEAMLQALDSPEPPANQE
jgi:uncharacterized protein with HEPN domain